MQINSLWRTGILFYIRDNRYRIFKNCFQKITGKVVWPVLCQQNRYTSVNGGDTKSWAGKRWGGWETWADLHVDGKSIQAKNRWPTGNIHYGRRKINNAFRRDELVCLIRIRLSTDSTTDWYSFFPFRVHFDGGTITDFAIKYGGNDWSGKKEKHEFHTTCACLPWEVTEILIFSWGYIYYWSFEKDIKEKKKRSG